MASGFSFALFEPSNETRNLSSLQSTAILVTTFGGKVTDLEIFLKEERLPEVTRPSLVSP